MSRGSRRRSGALPLTLGAAITLALGACDWSLQRMLEQERCEPDEATSSLSSGSCNLLPPDGVVPFPALEHEAPLPGAKLDRRALEQGRDHFELVCATCHGMLGDGVSEVAKHMRFRPPPSLHEQELLEKPDAFFLQVIRDGYGLMPSYAHMLSESERLGIVAYVRVLQRSQNAALDELPLSVRQEATRWLH